MLEPSSCVMQLHAPYFYCFIFLGTSGHSKRRVWTSGQLCYIDYLLKQQQLQWDHARFEIIRNHSQMTWSKNWQFLLLSSSSVIMVWPPSGQKNDVILTGHLLTKLLVHIFNHFVLFYVAKFGVLIVSIIFNYRSYRLADTCKLIASTWKILNP